MAVKRGIDKSVVLAVEELQKLSKPVSGDMIAQGQAVFPPIVTRQSAMSSQSNT